VSYLRKADQIEKRKGIDACAKKTHLAPELSETMFVNSFFSGFFIHASVFAWYAAVGYLPVSLQKTTLNSARLIRDSKIFHRQKTITIPPTL